MSVTDTAAPLDLDAIEARYREAAKRTGATTPAWRSAADVPALVARVRDLTAKLDASAQAFDALLDVVECIDGERPKSPAATPQALAGYATARWRRLCNELSDARVATMHARAERDAAQRERETARREGAEAMREECARYADEAARTWRQESSVAAHELKGVRSAECAAMSASAGAVAAAIRALPLPEVTP